MFRRAGLWSAFAVWSVAGSVGIAAQVPTAPVVRWTAAVDASTRIAPGTTVEVTLDAAIDPGWKLYAPTQEGAGQGLESSGRSGGSHSSVNTEA